LGLTAGAEDQHAGVPLAPGGPDGFCAASVGCREQTISPYQFSRRKNSGEFATSRNCRRAIVPSRHCSYAGGALQDVG
jgi:hypothetical protein